MDHELLGQLDAKTAAGLTATAFWVVAQRRVAIVKFSDGSEVGPFEYGAYWGHGADPDLAAKLAGRLFRFGLMDPATTEDEAVVMLCDDGMDHVINQVFPSDLPAELLDLVDPS